LEHNLPYSSAHRWIPLNGAEFSQDSIELIEVVEEVEYCEEKRE